MRSSLLKTSHVAALIAALLSLCMQAPPASAQERSRVVRDLLREKLRWTPAQVEQALRERGLRPGMPLPAPTKAAMLETAEGESVVSGSSDIESEVDAAINPKDSNNIIVSPIRSNIGALDQLVCPIYYSRDFGRTWMKSSFQTLPRADNPIVLGGGDPILVFDGDGTAYIIWISIYFENFQTQALNVGLFWAFSKDGGASWTLPENDAVAYSVSSQSSDGDFFDKEWAAVDRSNKATRNTVYVAFLHAGTTFGQKIAVRKKAPAATSFTDRSVPVSDDSFQMVQFSGVDVDPDGGVHVTFFGSKDTTAGYSIWHSVSNDGGESFSEPKPVSAIHIPGFSPGTQQLSIPGIDPARLYPAPQLAIDNSNAASRGNLYMTWTADGFTSDLGSGLDVYFSRSEDNGATWSRPVVVHHDPRGVIRHQHYSSISVSPGGVVAVTWYDRRSDPENRITNYYIAYSFDGGSTFTEGAPVTSQATDFSTVGEQNQNFGIGEYTAVLTTSGYAIPVWTDGRSGNGDLDILAAVVPISREAAGVERLGSVTDELAMSDPVVNGNTIAVTVNLNAASHLQLRLFDLLGRLVATIADGPFESGPHAFSCNAAAIPAGHYFLTAESSAGRATRQVVIAR
ncbi:MAG TPA: hypothetical protein VHI13_06635 [Candidatus Kapabacteria bacterium]|nr:hypothetical protein [Candidatus Kapabacteria bacterium]